MKADYLTLDNGQKVRIVFNMNAVELFTNSSGVELAEMAKMDKARTDVALLRKLAHACAIEGERMEGRSFTMNELDFGGVMSIVNMTEFSEILSRQGGASVQKKRPIAQIPWWRKVRTR